MSEHPKVVLTVSTDPLSISRLEEILTQEGWGHKIARQPDEVCAILACKKVDLVIIDMQHSTDLKLAMLCEIKNRYPHLPIITIAGICDIDTATGSLKYGAYGYVTKPLFSVEVTRSIREALDKSRLELKLRQLESTFDVKLEEKCKEVVLAAKRTLATLSMTLEASDPFTAGHSRRVSTIATAIGKKMGLDKELLDDILWGSLLHDIGKIAIDRHIVNKPSKLTEEEYAHVMTHPLVGATIVSQVISSVNIADIIEYHHYFYNGNGYGQIVKGESIPLLARILAVADAYDAMTSSRPYRPALSKKEAIAEISRNVGSQFDPIVASAFLKLSTSDMTEDRNKVLSVRGEQSDRLLLKSVLFNKYARAEWVKYLSP